MQQDYFYNPNADTNLMDLVMDNCVQCVMLRMAKKALRLANNEEDFDVFTTPDNSTIRSHPGSQHRYLPTGSPQIDHTSIRAFPFGYTGSESALSFVQRQIDVFAKNSLCGGQQVHLLLTRVLDLRHSTQVRRTVRGKLTLDLHGT